MYVLYIYKSLTGSPTFRKEISMSVYDQNRRDIIEIGVGMMNLIELTQDRGN